MIPTPFRDNRIDFDSLLRLFDHLFPELEGYTICGSTGEAPSLTIDERLELMKFAARNTPSSKTIAVGLTHTSLEDITRLARSAQELGIHAGLVPCPYYFPNTFPMVLEFFRALDRASSLELVLYDNPVYTKTWLSADQLLVMVDACQHLKSVKLTDHALDKIPVLKQHGVTVFSGDDVVAFRSLMLGVDGSMIIAPAVFPAAYQETVRLLREGKTAESLRVFSSAFCPSFTCSAWETKCKIPRRSTNTWVYSARMKCAFRSFHAAASACAEVVMAYDLCQSAAVQQHA